MFLQPEASLFGPFQAAGTDPSNAVKHCRWVTESSTVKTHLCYDRLSVRRLQTMLEPIPARAILVRTQRVRGVFGWVD